MSPGEKHKELLAQMPAPLRHAAAPFPITTRTAIAKDLAYPRAGIRLQPDGKWLMQIWFAPDLVRVDPRPLTHTTRLGALRDGQRQTYAARSRAHPAGQIHLRGVGMEPTA